jgi:hypothetical protein
MCGGELLVRCVALSRAQRFQRQARRLSLFHQFVGPAQHSRLRGYRRCVRKHAQLLLQARLLYMALRTNSCVEHLRASIIVLGPTAEVCEVSLAGLCHCYVIRGSWQFAQWAPAAAAAAALLPI